MNKTIDIILVLIFILSVFSTTGEATPQTRAQVTLNVIDADLVEVLKAYSLQTGESIVVSPNVPPVKISIQISNVSGNEFLDKILTPNGLCFKKAGDTIIIDVVDTQSSPELNDAKKSQPGVSLGDSYQSVIKKHGDPNIEFPLAGGKTAVWYEHSKFIFENNKLVSIELVDPDRVAQERIDGSSSQASTLNDLKQITYENATLNISLLKNELLSLIKRQSELRQQTSYYRSISAQYMSLTISSFNLMVDQGDKWPASEKKSFLDKISSGNIDSFYNININYEYYERQYSNSPEALLTLISLKNHHSEFIDRYEQYIEFSKALSQTELKIKEAQKNLDRLEILEKQFR